MQLAGAGNYFYCDTDSLIVNGSGLANLSSLISGSELGKLKIVKAVKHLIIRGLKDYSTDTETIIKGIRKNAVMISDGHYEQQEWPSFKGLLGSNKPNTYLISKVTKRLSREYTKGIVTKSGIVRPLQLSQTQGIF